MASTMWRTLRVLLCLTLLIAGQRGWAMSVAFINPGRSGEGFWVTATEAMQAAAQSLGVRLEVFYAERDPQRSLLLARDLASRPMAQRPDYVILVNDKGTLVPNARLLGEHGVRCFAAFSGLLPQERKQWAPRRGLPLLMGSLEPGAREAGYLAAQALIAQGLRDKRQGADGKLHLLAIAGDRSTPVSIKRNEGLRQALSEHPEVELDQQVFADWRRDLATEQMRKLMQRHARARLLWAGNDQMAFGAMDALEQAGGRPGRELIFSAINNSPEAMRALLDDRLAALAGGHFMAGAWALVMLYDLHHGHDFVDEGLELERPMFMLFSKGDAQRYLQRFGGGPQGLNFRSYSKVLNPGLKHYSFRLEQLLRQ